MNEAQRKALLAQYRGMKSKLSALEGEMSRFARLLNANNIIDTQKTTATKTTKVSSAVTAKPKKDVKVPGKPVLNPMYDLEMEFSPDGSSYANPLVNPTSGGSYYVRVRIRQHQSEVLIQGFSIKWYKPSGWSWVDGIGSTTTDETMSNPLVITRVAKAPSSNRGGSFRAVVIKKFYR